MISLKMIKSSSNAVKYYSQPDYISAGKEVESKPEWFGDSVEKLELSPDISRQKFQDVLDGKVDSSRSIGRETKDGVLHKPGWDVVFSAPKGVSIMALTGGDSRLIEAHQASVKTALKYLEKNYIVTRKSENGSVKLEKTGNMVSSLFTHTTSRMHDPQLHTHSVIANMTQRSDGLWRSIESKTIYENTMIVGQIYRSELAKSVKQLGYEIDIDRQKGFFDIASVPDDVIKAFSKRRESVEKAVEEYGYKTAKGRDNATVRTRKNKESIDKDKLLKQWEVTLDEHGYNPSIDVEKAVNNTSKEIQVNGDKLNTDVTFSYESLTQKEAVLTEEQLLDYALKYTIGDFNSQDVLKEVDHLVKDKTLVHASNSGHMNNAYTTPHALKTEASYINVMNKSKNSVVSLASKSVISDVLSSKSFEKGQAESLQHILSTRDRIIGVQGYAGTGKTFMLSAVNDTIKDPQKEKMQSVLAEIKQLLSRSKYTIKGFAPTATAAEQLAESSGIESNTLASHLYALKHQKKMTDRSKEIWVVDEASLIRSEDMASLLEFSDKTKARVVLVGDVKQIAAIEWGKPFDQLVKAGMSTSEMKEIRRQKESPALLNAVYDSLDGKVKAALDKITHTVIQEKEKHDRVSQIVEKYLELSPEDREKMLVLIPDNQTRTDVNAKIQNGLKSKGILFGTGKMAETYTNKGLNKVEKGNYKFYKEGDIVQFGRDYSTLGVSKDQYYRVVDIDNEKVFISSKTGEKIAWDPNKVAGSVDNGVEVYKTEKKHLHQGDQIVWKKKDVQRGLKNGYKGVVTSLDDNNAKVKFTNGIELSFDLKKDKHWDLAYATTIFSAQGATYDNVIVHAESWRKNLLNQKSFYVALSRAKHNAYIYTDDSKKLSKDIPLRLGDKTSALDSVSQKHFDINGLMNDFRQNEKEKLSIGQKIKSFGKDLTSKILDF